MKAALRAFVLAALAASAAQADRVVMPDDIELGGKNVEIREIRPGEILVRVAYGEITIPRQRIDRIEVDFASRLERLKAKGKDTPRELFLLGRVCAALDMRDEALAAYRHAIARGNTPDDLLLPLASEFESRGAWRAAHRCYADYLKAHPDNADVQAKAAAAAEKAAEMLPEVEPAAHGPGPIEIAVKPSTFEPGDVQKPLQPPAQEPGQKPEPGQEPPQKPAKPDKPGVQEGLEADPGWSTEAWGSTVKVSVAAPEGGMDRMLRIFLAGAERDKANVMLEDDFDFSRAKSMSFEVYNLAKKPIQIAAAFITRGPNFPFYESIPKTIMHTGTEKPQLVTLDLTGNRFKCAATKWRYRSPLNNRNQIIKIYLLIYTKLTGEWIFVNNIRFQPIEGVELADLNIRGAPRAPRPARRPPRKPAVKKPEPKPQPEPAAKAPPKPADPAKPAPKAPAQPGPPPKARPGPAAKAPPQPADPAKPAPKAPAGPAAPAKPEPNAPQPRAPDGAVRPAGPPAAAPPAKAPPEPKQ